MIGCREKPKTTWTVRLWSTAVILRAFKNGSLLLERNIEPELPQHYVELLRAGYELPVKFRRIVRLKKSGQILTDRRIVRTMGMQ